MKYYECFVARFIEVHYSRVFLADSEAEAELKFQAWLESADGEAAGRVRTEEEGSFVIDEVGPMEYQVQLDED